MTPLGVTLCSLITQKVMGIYNEAKAAGITLSANSGFRTYERQKELYKPGGWVAVPGNSMHERGLAIDFSGFPTKNDVKYHLERTVCGAGISKGYDWMCSNGAKYGFINLHGATIFEPWHWSMSGS